MLGLSLHAWENVMVGSLAFAALVAAIVGVSTYCVVQLQRQEIAASKSEFYRYKLETERNISEANARQREAELKLEQLRTQARPRHLTVNGDAFIAALNGKPKAPVEIMFPKDDGEAFLLAIGLRDLLRKAEWQAA